MKKRFLLVDDHPVFRQGLAALLETVDSYAITGEAGDWDEAVTLLERDTYDIVIVDLSLRDRDGLELLKHLGNEEKRPLCLALSMHDELVYAEKAIEAGALGYVMKHAPPETILEAVDAVLSGNRYLSPRVKQQILDAHFEKNPGNELNRLERLSPREREILELIGQGFGATEMADRLNLSVKTVHTYRDHLKEKLEMETAQELRRFAIQWHIGSST